MRRLWITVSCAAIFACNSRNHIPGDVIPPDSMEVVLRDVIVADQYAQQFLLKDSLTRNVKRETLGWYDEVFKMHHVTRESFRESLNFYESRPDLAKNLFDTLAARGSRDRMNSLKRTVIMPLKMDSATLRQRRVDSLRRPHPVVLHPAQLHPAVLSPAKPHTTGLPFENLKKKPAIPQP